MDFGDARQLVLKEGIGEDGILVSIRMGEIPPSSRMVQLLSALEIVYQHLHI